VFEKLLPCIMVYYAKREILEEKPDLPEEEIQLKVSIVKLSKFIDGFNFYPLRVNKIHSKNDSEALTYIMTANKSGSLIQNVEENKLMEKHQRNDEQKRLIKLLMLISNKLSERFRNLREAFRYIDTDHSSSISLNEFS
jgi:hypothetical protein